MSRIHFYNIFLDVLTRRDAKQRISSFMDGNKTETLFFLNAHCFNIAQENNKYRTVIKSAGLLLNDGIGIEIAARFAGIKIMDNLNGTDLIPEIISIANDKGKTIYLLGGKPGIAEIAAQKLKSRFLNIKILGFNDGYFLSKNEKETILDINNKNIDILIVGMGVPLQEIWINENLNKLPTLKLAVAGGAIFDFISEHFPRAPLWMRKCRIEWVYRIFLEPERLSKRYILGSIVLLGYCLKLNFSKKNPI